MNITSPVSVTTTATDEVKLDNAVNTVTLGQSKLDLLGSYGVNIYGNSGDIVLGDGASVVNNTLLTISDTNQSVKLTNATQSTDYFEQQLSTTIGGTSNLIIKSESGGVRFHNSSNVQRATFNYAQLTDKITMECVGTGTVALTAGTGGLELSTDSDLVFTGAALQSGTSGGSCGQHLRIKLNGVFYKIKLEND